MAFILHLLPIKKKFVIKKQNRIVGTSQGEGQLKLAGSLRSSPVIQLGNKHLWFDTDAQCAREVSGGNEKAIVLYF